MNANANKLLDNARVSNPGRPVGCATLGRIIVTWDRVAEVYDVGTDARSHAKGRRSVVLPVLDKMIADGVGQ